MPLFFQKIQADFSEKQPGYFEKQAGYFEKQAVFFQPSEKAIFSFGRDPRNGLRGTACRGSFAINKEHPRQ